jgi:hypothetical protein
MECQQAVVAISKQNRDRIDWTGRLVYCPRFDRFCRIRSKDFLPTDCRYETCHPAGITVNILTFSKQREVFFFKLVPSSFSCASQFISTPYLLNFMIHEVSRRPPLCPYPQPYNTVHDPIPYCFITFYYYHIFSAQVSNMISFILFYQQMLQAPPISRSLVSSPQ